LFDEQHVIVNPQSEESEYSFVVTSEMTPNFLLMASYIREDNEVVADYISMNAALKLENQVSIKFVPYSNIGNFSHIYYDVVAVCQLS